jgi:signal transduction histidine kinase
MEPTVERRELTERWFNRLILGALALGFLALLAAGVGAGLTVAENQRHTAWVNHTYQVERQISQLRVLLERVEAARRGLLLSDHPYIRQTFVESVDRLPDALASVRRVTADNPRQQRGVAVLRGLLVSELNQLQGTYGLVAAGRRNDAIEDFRRTRQTGLVLRMRVATGAMLAEEDRLLIARNGEQRQSLNQFMLIMALAAVLLIAVAVGSILVILRYLRDLRTSRQALRLLNEDLEGAVQVRTTDLQRANEEIQRFAYIVSHDLRSPLVNVMGFTAELEAATREIGKLIDRAETEAPALVTADARLAAREDLPEAIGFIRTSTAKMDRLINAILRLSREGRRPITPERLDLDGLVHGIADTVKHRSDELGAEIIIRPGLPTIVSDRVAVEQVLSNIIENALKYLQLGRPARIEVSGRRDGGRVLLKVADNGRGIDPRDHDRIFDLFRRSGVQDQPGEGIGLAHTRALAYRLGGTITVDSALGRGATFAINLPAVFAGEAGSSS